MLCGISWFSEDMHTMHSSSRSARVCVWHGIGLVMVEGVAGNQFQTNATHCQLGSCYLAQAAGVS